MTQPTSPDPSKVALGFKNILGQQKQVTLKDLENWQKGKGENFFVRTFNQVRTLFSSNVLVTDARVKEMMKRMDPATMKQITDTFKEALNEPEKKPEMLALANTFSKHQGSIGRKSPDFSQSAITQVYELKQVMQISSAAKMLTDFGVENVLKSIVLEGAFHRNEAGFKATGVGGDFIKFYEAAEDKSDINKVFKDFIKHTIDQGNKGKDLKGYPKDPAIDNYLLFASLSYIENLGKDHPFEQIKDKSVQELVTIMGNQVKKQTINKYPQAKTQKADISVRDILLEKEMTADRLYELIENPQTRPLIKEIFELGGRGKDFQVEEHYLKARNLSKQSYAEESQSKADKLERKVIVHAEKSSKLQGDRYIGDVFDSNLDFIRNVRNQFALSKSILTPKLLLDMIKNPLSRPIIENVYAHLINDVSFQFFVKAADYEKIQEKLGEERDSNTLAQLKIELEDKGNEIEDLINSETLNIKTPQMKKDLKNGSIETKIKVIRNHLLLTEVGDVEESIRKALLTGEKLSVTRRATDIENLF